MLSKIPFSVKILFYRFTATAVFDIIIKKGDRKMNNYVCTVCGYVYYPEEGDADSGIAPGTAFENLPDNWVCPICGASKDDFKLQE